MPPDGGVPDAGVGSERREPGDEERRASNDHDDDDETKGHEDHDDADRVPPSELAGRTVLRVETQNADGTWTTTVDTSAISRVPVDSEPFTIPQDWTATDPTSSPSSVSPAFDTDNVPCTTDGAPIIGQVIHPPIQGPLIKHAEIYMNYLGDAFAKAHASDPDGFDSVYTAGASQVFDPSYFAGLRQYGMRSGKVVRTRFVPSLQALNVTTNAITDVATVEDLMLGGAVPMFWWKIGASDPLVVLVADHKEDSRTSYHMAAPSLAFMLPFPANLFAYDFIPYAFVSFPHESLPLSAATLAARDEAGAGCASFAIQNLDSGTADMSHEVVEALTDPYPFFSWSDPALFPPWFHSEIADICDLGCTNLSPPVRRTRVGNTVLTTYWSNADSDCVGGPRHPSIQILRPVAGQISWVPGVTVRAEASIQDSVSGGACAGTAVTWSIDGVSAEMGSPVDIPIATAGPHTIRARFTDLETGESVDASVTVTAVEELPTGGPVCTGDLGDSCQCFATPRSCGIDGVGCTLGTEDCVGNDWSSCAGNTCQPFPVGDTPKRSCDGNISPQDCYFWETVCDEGYHVVACDCANGQSHGFCSFFAKDGRLGELHTHESGGFYATSTAHLTNCSCVRDGF
jgi:hypothetical protein